MGEERGRRETRHLIRLHFLVEGQTEEAFVNLVLAPALGTVGVYADACRITTGRHRGRVFRGGFVRYAHLAADLILRMKQDPTEESWFTTMVDFYRLPTDFPGLATLDRGSDAAGRIAALQAAFTADIARQLNHTPVSRRFIPYIQQHEFEALLFSDPEAFAAVFPDRGDVGAIRAIRAGVTSPEEIDDGPDTAPSRRILACFDDYQKPVHGVLITNHIGLDVICRECPGFRAWIARLRSLSAGGG